MQRITGPHKGYWVAAYTQITDGGYVGVGKACAERPEKAWRAEAVIEVHSSVYDNETQALLAAEHKLRLEIDQLPPSWAPFTEPGALVDTRAGKLPGDGR